MYVDLRQTALYSALTPLSGGMSFLSTQYGWAANNVVNFEVVLANGTVVNANAKENTGKKYASQSSARFY
jgi:hypothetical protein